MDIDINHNGQAKKIEAHESKMRMLHTEGKVAILELSPNQIKPSPHNYIFQLYMQIELIYAF